MLEVFALPEEEILVPLKNAPAGLVGAGLEGKLKLVGGADVIAWTDEGFSEEADGEYVWTIPGQPEGRYVAALRYAGTEVMDLVRVDHRVQAPLAAPYVGYPSAEDFVAMSSVDDLTNLTLEQADGLRSSSIAAIEDYCGQTFGGTEVATKLVRAAGSSLLYLPARLESVDAIAVEGVSQTLSDVVLADEHDRLHLPAVVGGNYYERTLRELAGEPSPRSWHGEVAVTGTWGWPTVPENIITAIRFDMEEQAVAEKNGLAPTIMAMRKLGVRDVSQGNLRMTIGDEVVLSGRVVRLLNAPGLLWQGIPGALV